MDLETGPGGDLYYIRIGTGQNDGELRRISYGGEGNQAPVASATADPDNGPTPLEVTFDGSASQDPDGDALVYAWDLDGDGGYDDSDSVRPTHTYLDAGRVLVRLRVTDPDGATATTVVVVTPGAVPPTVTIDAPTQALRWAVGDEISFSGSAADAHGNALPDSALTWQVVLHHCIGGSASTDCHQHPLQSFSGVGSGSLTAPEHDYPAFLELRLTATAASGLTDSEVLRLDPRTVDLRFATSPAGLELAAGRDATPTPFTLTAIVGMPITVTAPAQTSGGTSYEFQSWSDAGETTHTIVAPATATTYTATFRHPGSALFDGDPATTERLQGATPPQQAITISQARFPGHGAAHVALSRDDIFADALAGTSLLSDGPLLLIASDAVPAEALAEIDRVLPSGGRIYLLGGEQAISAGVERQLDGAGFEVVRLAGASRVETSVAVAQEALRLNPAAPDLLLARADGPAHDPTAAWSDSVTGGAWAARTRSPIVLTQTEALHPAVNGLIASMQPARTILLGGVAALSARVEGEVPHAQRVDGANRADTAALIASQLWTITANRYVLINGYHAHGWAYGLPAAGLSADEDAPLLVSHPTELPPETLLRASSPCGAGANIDMLLAGAASLLGDELIERLDAADGGPCPAGAARR